MQFKPPKDDDKFHWTNHVKNKMVQYKLSESLIKRILRFPKRTEEGIATDTIAVMQPVPNKKKPTEIWVMYATVGSQMPEIRYRTQAKKKIIISAWRYPGVTTPGKKIFIPDDTLEELRKWFEK